jgi:tRNA-binding protein
MQFIDYADFEKIDIRVGRITRAEEFPRARKPAYKLWIDFGEIGEKQSSAQITSLYSKDELIGKLVAAVINFRPKQVADFISEVLVLGVVVNENDVVLLQPDKDVPCGKRIL